MSKTPKYDTKIKEILDALEPSERACEMSKEKWVMDAEEIEWYKKFNVPPSPFSPRLRLWHLASYMTTYQWWWNKHIDTDEPVLTYLHPKPGIRAIPDKEWFDRDFSDKTLDYDDQKPFFEMFRELQLMVPVNATRNVKPVERSIATVSQGDIDSYFVAGCSSKNCFYSEDVLNQENTIDANGAMSLNDCYHINHSQRLHNCKFVYESYDCVNSSFLFDCRNCEFCIGISNKRNKKYMFWGEQLNEEEWNKKASEMDLSSYSELEKLKSRFYEMIEKDSVWPENFNIKCQDCTGEYLISCTDCKNSILGVEATDNYHCIGLYNARGNAFSIAIPGERNYQSGMVGDTSNCKFSSSLIRCDDLEYCFNCYDCEHCFGCCALRHKKFCIFNKQYSEEEYWDKIDKLKCAMLDRGEYGRPLPTKFSFGYFPESGIAVYLGADLTDENWEKSGMLKFDPWEDGAYGEMRLDSADLRNRDDIPDKLDDVGDEWVGVPILDPDINRPFAYLKPEMEFYRKHRIAPPREHFTARIRNLMRASNQLDLQDSNCANCKKVIQASKNPTFQERNVYCQDCYLGHIEKYG